MCPPGQAVSNGSCVNVPPCGVRQDRNDNGSCVCISGYLNVSGTCYQICSANAVIMNGACGCIPGFSYNSTQNKCIENQGCTNGFVLSNGVCVCAFPKGIIGLECLACPSNSYVDLNGKCTCQSGYNLVGKVCQAQPVVNCSISGQSYNGVSCECAAGWVVFQGKCNDCTTSRSLECGLRCPEGQVVDPNLVRCSYCNASGEVIGSDGRCGCVSTYRPTSTGCVLCQANSQYSVSQQKCACNSGFSASSAGECIQCPSNSALDPATAKCLCSLAGQFLINGSCQSCPQNTQFNSTTASCVCSQGYVRNSQGQCQQCSASSSLSTAGTECVCNAGFYGNGFSCQACAASCRTCSGPSANQCLTCNSGSPSSGVCQASCPSSQYKDANNQCQSCTAHCTTCTSTSTCSACENGFSLTTGSSTSAPITCQNSTPSTTPSGLEIVLKNHVLLNGKIYLGVTINVLPNSVLAGNCAICNDIFKVSVNSMVASVQTTQQYVNNTAYWFAVSFEFPGAGFVPTFEYIISLNPAHATYFTPLDMTIVKRGTLSSNDFPAASTINTNTTGKPTAGSSMIVSPTPGGAIQSDTITKLFGPQ
jgi:hypothetical protein